MFSSWNSDALEGYVKGGLVTSANGVRLACAPSSEAACYTGPGRSVFSELAGVACPVSILVGEASKHLDSTGKTTLEHFTDVAGLFRNGRLVVVPGGGHFHPQEKPAAVATAVNLAITMLTNRVHGQTSKL